jgi:hypothetical protein
MVSLKNGVLKVDYNKEDFVRLAYDICFVFNAVTLFAFYDVKFIGTLTGILMLIVSVFIWIGRRNTSVVIPYNTVWYLTFTVFAAMSSLWSSYINSDMASYFLRMVVIIAMITSVSIYVDKPEDLERIIKLYITSVLIIVLLEFSAVPVSEWTKGSMGSHFSGSNPNGVAFMVFCAELMAFYEFYSKNKKGYLLIVALFLVFIIFTSSRKGLFASLAGPLMFVVFSTYKKNYLLNILTVFSLVAVVLVFIMTDETAYYAIGRRLNSMFNFVFESQTTKTDNSMYMRLYYINLAQEMFAESPILGKGMGNFAKIIDNVYMLNGVYSHNNFWQILSELGIVGFVIYYSMYFYLIVKLAKGAFINKSRVNLLFFVFMVLLMILETGLVNYNSKMPHVVIAIAYAATYVGEMDGRQYRYIKNHETDSE